MGSGRTAPLLEEDGARLSSVEGRRTEGTTGGPLVDCVSGREVREEEGGRGAVVELRRGDVPWTPRVRLSSRESRLACSGGRDKHQQVKILKNTEHCWRAEAVWKMK